MGSPSLCCCLHGSSSNSRGMYRRGSISLLPIILSRFRILHMDFTAIIMSNVAVLKLMPYPIMLHLDDTCMSDIVVTVLVSNMTLCSFWWFFVIIKGTWWYKSIKYSGDKILLPTQQLYFYFINKTPNMMFKSKYEYDLQFHSIILHCYASSQVEWQYYWLFPPQIMID